MDFTKPNYSSFSLATIFLRVVFFISFCAPPLGRAFGIYCCFFSVQYFSVNFYQKKRKKKKKMERGKRVKSASSMSFLWMIFKQADGLDKCLMIIGFIGASVNGLTPPFMVLIASKIMNSLAGASSSTPLFIHDVNKVIITLLPSLFFRYIYIYISIFHD